jgi:hypothetical protein
MGQEFDRRRAIKIITIGGALATLVLPSRWTKPVIEAVVVPAHAQASPFLTTTTLPPP